MNLITTQTQFHSALLLALATRTVCPRDGSFLAFEAAADRYYEQLLFSGRIDEAFDCYPSPETLCTWYDERVATAPTRPLPAFKAIPRTARQCGGISDTLLA